jgi:hypothetical protein
MMAPRFDASTTVVSEADARLIAIEFGDVPFEVKRIFTVTRAGAKVTRGNHFAGCNQKLVLLAGEVDVHLKKASGEVKDFHFTESGNSVLISPDDHVTYELLDENSQILVLADQSYEDSLESRNKLS